MNLDDIIKSVLASMNLQHIVTKAVEAAINDSIHQMFMSDSGQALIKSLMVAAPVAPSVVADIVSASEPVA